MIRPYDDVDLHAFVDDQVGPDRRQSIGAYLKSAPVDAARVDLWRRQNEAIQAVFAHSAGEAIPLWLTVGQIASVSERPVPLPKRPSGKTPRPSTAVAQSGSLNAKTTPSRLLISALAFAAGVFLPAAAARFPGLQGLHILSWTSESQQGFARRALEAHDTFGTDVDRPVDVVDSPAGSLREWLERRVPFPVRVPNLSADGWSLRGGRLAPGDLGPGAFLVYQRGVGDRISLYVARVASGFGQKGPALVDGNGVLSWSEGSVGYGVATTLPPPWLVRHADDLRSIIGGEDGG